MNVVTGIPFVILGTIFVLWPRALWWLRWGWLPGREPTRAGLALRKFL